MKTATAKKRTGRPAKPAERKRVQLGIIVSSRMKTMIDEEAQRSGRSQGQVCEWLLERAMQYDTMLSAMKTTVEQITGGNIDAAFQGKGYVPVRTPYGKAWLPPDYPLQRSGFQPWRDGEQPKPDEAPAADEAKPGKVA